MKLVKHRRQYTIMKTKFISDEFKYHKINDLYWLSYHKDVDLKIFNNVIILGMAYQSDSRKSIDLESYFSDVTDGNIDMKIQYLTGKHIVIYDNMLYGDYVMHYNINYCHDENIISSSIKIISELTGHNKLCDNIELIDSDGLDAFVGYHTPVIGIDKLLHFEKIELTSDFKIHNRDMFKMSFNDMSEDEKDLLWIESITHVVDGILKYNSDIKIKLGMTAGYDSRTIFGILKKYNYDFDTFIFQRTHTDEACNYYEYIIPEIISDEHNVNFTLVENNTIIKEYRDFLYESHLVEGYPFNTVTDSFGTSQNDFMGENDLFITISLLGLAITERYDWCNGMESNRESIYNNYIKHWGSFFNKCEYGKESLEDLIFNRYTDELINNVKPEILTSLSLMELGCGQDYVSDMCDFKKIILTNSRFLHELISDLEMDNGEHRIRLIGKIMPELLKYKFNPKDGVIYNEDKKS